MFMTLFKGFTVEGDFIASAASYMLTTPLALDAACRGNCELLCRKQGKRRNAQYIWSREIATKRLFLKCCERFKATCTRVPSIAEPVPVLPSSANFPMQRLVPTSQMYLAGVTKPHRNMQSRTCKVVLSGRGR